MAGRWMGLAGECEVLCDGGMVDELSLMVGVGMKVMVSVLQICRRASRGRVLEGEECALVYGSWAVG